MQPVDIIKTHIELLSDMREGLTRDYLNSVQDDASPAYFVATQRYYAALSDNNSRAATLHALLGEIERSEPHWLISDFRLEEVYKRCSTWDESNSFAELRHLLCSPTITYLDHQSFLNHASATQLAAYAREQLLWSNDNRYTKTLRVEWIGCKNNMDPTRFSVLRDITESYLKMQLSDFTIKQALFDHEIDNAVAYQAVLDTAPLFMIAVKIADRIFENIHPKAGRRVQSTFERALED